MMKRLLLFSCCLVFGLRVIPAASADTKPTFTVSFTMPADDRVPVIDVTFATGYVGRFALDTETSHSIISDTTAAILRLKQHPAVFDNGTPFLIGGKQPQMADASGMKFGNSGDINLSLIVLMHENMPFKVDGIIGGSFFEMGSMFLDFGAKIATYWYHSSPSEAVRSSMGLAGAVAVPMKYDDNFHFSVHAKYRAKGSENTSKDEEVIVSTGAYKSRVSMDAAKGLKLKPIEKGQKIETASGALTYSEALLDSVEIGSLSVNK